MRPAPSERAGRRLGVVVFWLLAIAFTIVTTRSVVIQVFGDPSRYVANRSASCREELALAAEEVQDPASLESPTDDSYLPLDALLTRLRDACGSSDPTVQELTAVVMRIRKRLARDAAASIHDRSRLTSALQRYSSPAARSQE